MIEPTLDSTKVLLEIAKEAIEGFDGVEAYVMGQSMADFIPIKEEYVVIVLKEWFPRTNQPCIYVDLKKDGRVWVDNGFDPERDAYFDFRDPDTPKKLKAYLIKYMGKCRERYLDSLKSPSKSESDA